MRADDSHLPKAMNLPSRIKGLVCKGKHESAGIKMRAEGHDGT